MCRCSQLLEPGNSSYNPGFLEENSPWLAFVISPVPVHQLAAGSITEVDPKYQGGIGLNISGDQQTKDQAQSPDGSSDR